MKVRITNVGERDGIEVVQLYVRDDYATITRPSKELKDFVRVDVPRRQSRDVTLRVPISELAIIDANGVPLVEPGTFTLWVGNSSAGGLEAQFEVTP